MLKIVFCASLYTKTEDFNLLAELIARHKRDYADRYQIDLAACATAEDTEPVLARMSHYDALVPYIQPPSYEGEILDYVITRKVFQCLRLMLDWAQKAGYDYAIFLHSDLYPLDFGKIAAILETMRAKNYLVAARGRSIVFYEMWMDDNIMFFDLRLRDHYPDMFDIEKDKYLSKPMFHYGIHYILPFWMMRYLAPEEFYFFSDCAENVGYDGKCIGYVPTPLNYDADLKILHANHFGYWGGTGEAPQISAVKQRIFRENGNLGEPGSETEKFLAMKYKFENPALRRLKNKIRPLIGRGAAKTA